MYNLTLLRITETVDCRLSSTKVQQVPIPSHEEHILVAADASKHEPITTTNDDIHIFAGVIYLSNSCGFIVQVRLITITIYFIHPSGKLKLSFDRIIKNIYLNNSKS